MPFAAPLGWTVAYALWAIASTLWSTHLGSTATQLASLAIAISYMLAFAALLQTRRDMNLVLYTIAVVAVVVGIYGMISSQGRAGTDTGDANFFAVVEIIALRSSSRSALTCSRAGSGSPSTRPFS